MFLNRLVQCMLLSWIEITVNTFTSAKVCYSYILQFLHLMGLICKKKAYLICTKKEEIMFVTMFQTSIFSVSKIHHELQF